MQGDFARGVAVKQEPDTGKHEGRLGCYTGVASGGLSAPHAAPPVQLSAADVPQPHLWHDNGGSGGGGNDASCNGGSGFPSAARSASRGHGQFANGGTPASSLPAGTHSQGFVAVGSTSSSAPPNGVGAPPSDHESGAAAPQNGLPVRTDQL